MKFRRRGITQWKAYNMLTIIAVFVTIQAYRIQKIWTLPIVQCSVSVIFETPDSGQSPRAR